MSAASSASSLVVLCLSFCSLSASQPAKARPEIPVQISTVTSMGTFRTLRGTLFFEPPDGLLHFVKQLHKESSRNANVHVSLRLYSDTAAAATAAGNRTQHYLTRREVQQPEAYDMNADFGSFGDEYRLFQTRCCGCGRKAAPVTFYWPQVESSSLTRLLTASEDSDSSFALARTSITNSADCQSSNLKIQEHPYVELRSGAPHPTPAPTGRPRRSTGKILVQLVADYGGDKFVVGVARTNRNVIAVFPYRNMACKTGTTFYYEGFQEYHVDVDGQITSRASFTLQHAATRSFVVADVLDSIALNVGANLTGLRLQHEADFDPDTPTSPDYRFFVRYDMTDAEIFSPPTYAYGKYEPQSSVYAYSGYITPRQVHILCPLFHRRYCIEPTKSGPLRLAPVSKNDTRQSPTLMDPPFGFAEFSTRQRSGNVTPTFVFLPV